MQPVLQSLAETQPSPSLQPEVSMQPRALSMPPLGRRPSGFRQRPGTAISAVGAYFAERFELEVATHHAYVILCAELDALDAPKPLVESVERAVVEEREHIEWMRRLASRFAGVPVQDDFGGPASRPRSLSEIAVENMVEGCVRESFAAVIAGWQASHAKDHEVVEKLRNYAMRKTGHARLAWSIHRWSAKQLDELSRARVASAKEFAVYSLRDEIRAEPDPEVRMIAGVPTRMEAERLIDGLSVELWA